MKNKKKDSLIKSRIKSFANAFKGLRVLFSEEINARIHLVATLLVIGAGIYFDLSLYEWCFITIAIGIVLITEAINTAIENIMDFIFEEHHPKIGKIKDLAAGAVLIAAIVSVIIAALIFIPKMI